MTGTSHSDEKESSFCCDSYVDNLDYELPLAVQKLCCCICVVA